jgi:ATP-binding cassette, subfamily B, bacterial
MSNTEISAAAVLPSLPAAAPPKRLSNLAIIWKFVRRYPGHLTCAMIALLIAAGASLGMPGALRNVIDKGFGATDAATIAPYFHWMYVLAGLMAVATAMRFYFVTWIGERVVADVRAAVHAHLLSLSPEFFEENRPAEIASRLTTDTTIIEQVVGTSASMALRNMLMGIGGIVLMFGISPKLAGLLMLIIPLVIVPITLFGRKVRTLSRTSQDKIADIGAMADEALGGIRIVQGYTQEPREVSRFSAAVETAFAAARKRFTTRAMMTAVIILLMFCGIIAVLQEGARDVIDDKMSGGAMAQFVLLAILVGGAFGALTEVYGDVMRATGAAGRLAELLNTESKIQPPAHPVALPVPARGAVSFADVTFNYPSKPDGPALYDFSLEIASGETVAVVGPSGAGKSTLFQLIQRFYDPQSGSVRIDGVSLPTADPRDVRKRIAVVPQESVIFAASAYENILYGRPEATEAEVWAAAEAANVAQVLRELPQGIHSYLGEAGVRLSGGQRQRLSIARAILRNAPILLLDEATSALDSESERLVQSALDKLMIGRTTLVIAHRLATVINADRIIVMDGGRLVAQGTHSTLMSENGLYARLAGLQFNQANAA